MKALIIGATGATGKDLLAELLSNKAFSQITIFVRKRPEISDPKLKVVLCDFDHLENYRDEINGDVLFSCLGTTLKDAGSQEKQRKIDYEYQLQFAQLAAQQGVKHYRLISASFANSKSKQFYMQMKWALEDQVKTLNFESIAIFQPPLLIRKNTTRLGEKIAAIIMKWVWYFFESARPMKTELLAKALLHSALHQTTWITTY